MTEPSAHTRLPFTANMHFIKTCNFRCTYCFATFADIVGRPFLPDTDLFELARLVAGRFEKVTLVGGEPTLYRRLPELLAAVKQEGALTNVVTNGSRIDRAWLEAHAGNIDFLTLSIDSAVEETQQSVGRATKAGKTVGTRQYINLAQAARALGITVKVNTVVTTMNAEENLSGLIRELAPERWKILQAAPVEGQNDAGIQQLTPPDEQFEAYVASHGRALMATETRIVPEPIATIRGSYVMVDPEGRFFDSSSGRHHYSRPILEVGLDEALREVAFDAQKFLVRGGAADFAHRLASQAS